MAEVDDEGSVCGRPLPAATLPTTPMSSEVLLASDDGTHSGYLTVAGVCYALSVRTEVDAPPEFEGCPKLCDALAGHEEALTQRLKRNVGNPKGFVADLSDLLERLSRTVAQPAADLPSVAFYELLVSEMDAIGWGTLQSVSASLDELQLSVEDAAGRAHCLTLFIPPDYPRSPPRARVALPAPFELRWPADATGGAPPHSLSTALAQFRAALTRHQLLWDMLDDIDAHSWVRHARARAFSTSLAARRARAPFAHARARRLGQ